ncbi:MAG TPA: FtsX-like permease family protein [Caldilineaceae bacterium]|nr:FtsX-like permease family protein [Caldilineaceae bacterium]
MTLDPRWQKVVRDIVSNKTRTILVVLSIAVGIAALGMVTGSHVVMSHDLPTAYARINPTHGIIGLSGFDENLVQSIARMPEIAEAEGKTRIGVQVNVGADQWQDIRIFALADFNNIRINQLRSVSGAWPPPKRTILVERASLAVLNAQVGDTLILKTNDGEEKAVQIAGLAHDLTEISADFTGLPFAYMTIDTLEWLGYGRDFSRLYLTVADDVTNREHIQAVVDKVQSRLERGGYTVYWNWVPEPGKHEMEQFLTPMLLIFGVLGVLSLLLSCFLVVNIISAILAQQTRQIGVMKTIGARRGQIVRMYLLTTLGFSLLALLVAIPLGWLGQRANTNFMSGLMNFDVTTVGIPPQVLALEVAIGLVVPLLAALYPIWRGTRITVREAISEYGLGKGHFGENWLDRFLERIHGLSRPMLISLRNTFRRKGRLLLTLTTLTLASAIFIAVFSVRASLLLTLDDALSYWNYDISLNLNRPYRVDYLEREALNVPGVEAAESWGFWGTRRVRADGTNSNDLLLIAPQPNSQMIDPVILAGRWLLPDDENAVVINTDVTKDESDLTVGSTLVVDIEGREESWTVVGVVRGVLSGPFLYVNYPYFAKVTRTVGRAGTLQVITGEHDAAAQEQVARALDKHFAALGITVNSAETTSQTREQVITQFNVIIIILSVMAVLLAVVGGLGLMGTMSINVLERRREIGVMRAIGAGNRSILAIVVVEGVIIGALSWLVGTLLAVPMSRALSEAVGVGFIQAALSYRFSTGGAGGWLAVILCIAAVASLLPARSASRITVREVLAYE